MASESSNNTITSGNAIGTDRCVFRELVGATLFVEGTTEKVMGIEDPFMDPRGFTNPACAKLMFATATKMLDYADETCYYVKYQGIGYVITKSMFEFIL